MPMHTLKLLALLMIFAVAPATAGHRAGPPAASRHDAPACPYERARIAAAAKAAQAARGETRVTLGGGTSSGRWLFGLRDTPRDLTP
ncbi:MAG TPA: hypothetical protein VK192_12455 [Sphingomicrobium sp.]|nr:hypothetical protein [Sphingomicrobium sp.]